MENQHGGANGEAIYNDEIDKFCENKLLSYFLHVIGLKTKGQDGGDGNHNSSYYSSINLPSRPFFWWQVCCNQLQLNSNDMQC